MKTDGCPCNTCLTLWNNSQAAEASRAWEAEQDAAIRSERRAALAEYLGRTGVVINVTAGAVLSLNLPGATRWCILAFLVSNALIAYSARVQRDSKIFWMQATYLAISVVGVVRWFA